MFHYNNSKPIILSGHLEETRFTNKLKQISRVKPFTPDRASLMETAFNTKLGKHRVATAKPHIIKKYGILRRTESGKSYQEINWDNVPTKTILDRIYGIDSTFQFFGYNCGIDVTSNPDKVNNKISKLRWLKPLFEAVGIEQTAVCLIERNGKTNLTTALKQVIRGEKLIIISP